MTGALTPESATVVAKAHKVSAYVNENMDDPVIRRRPTRLIGVVAKLWVIVPSLIFEIEKLNRQLAETQALATLALKRAVDHSKTAKFYSLRVQSLEEDASYRGHPPADWPEYLS